MEFYAFSLLAKHTPCTAESHICVNGSYLAAAWRHGLFANATEARDDLLHQASLRFRLHIYDDITVRTSGHMHAFVTLQGTDVDGKRGLPVEF